MLALPAATLALLRSQATLVVPNRQRANALRVALGAAELAAGRRAWRAPEILPWSSFVSRELERGVRAAGYAQRVLQPLEEWLLWRAAAAAAATDHALLQAADLAQSAQRAAALMSAWRIVPASATEEGRLLHAVLGRFRGYCADLHALSASDGATWPAQVWPDSAGTWSAGLEDIGPVWEQRLAQAGVQCVADSAGEPAAAQILPCADGAQELLQAAHWCRTRLAQDPQARLLVVMPHLRRVQSAVLRAFDAELDTGLYAIEGGAPLTDHALARHALLLWQLTGSGLEFASAAELLRSSYVGRVSQAQRCRLELWLRDQRVTQLDVRLLLQITPAVAAGLGAELAGMLRQWSVRIQEAQRLRQSPAQWAQWLVDWLNEAGWPGAEPLGSEEQQLQQRVIDLLNELALLPQSGARWRCGEALEVLGSRLRGVHFEAARPDAAVTLTDDCADPLLRYDGIWVAGLTADRWPMPASAHALLPVAAQLQAGIPGASAADQLRRAERALQQWQRSTPQLMLSHALTEDQVHQQASPLLRAMPKSEQIPGQAAGADQSETSVAWRGMAIEQQRGSGELESYRQAVGQPWNPQLSLPGGTRALQLQSDCPYRAYAELRIGAGVMEEPAPGIDSVLRGLLLHGALEIFWRALPDQAALRALGTEPLETALQASVQQALRDEVQRRVVPPDAGSLRREAQRCLRLLRELMQWELRRAPFAVQELERAHQLELGAARLRLRFDRVDRLSDAAEVVLDYKSGRGAVFSCEEERLSQPQLPAYALAAGAAVSAVATVHVRPDGVSVRGAADQDGRLPRLPVTPLAWPEQLARWQQQLQGLADEFLQGHAAVQPQRGACRYCHLASSCRVRRDADEPQGTEPGNGG
ncbi:MAG: PD-(D/E)XK nuclease family protein [Steroidobacteraceae bacterium]